MIKKIYAGLMVGLLACVAFSGVAFAQCAGGGTFGYAADGTPVCSSASYGVTPYGSVAGDGLPQGSSNSGGSGRTQPTRTVIVNRYGAVALNAQTGTYGYSSQKNSEIEAQTAAIADCNDNCTVVGNYSNQCAAYAWGILPNGYGFSKLGGGKNKSIAERSALSACSKKAKNCQILMSECSVYGR